MAQKKKAIDRFKVGTLPEYQLVDIQNLTPYANNAKKHPPKQVEQIAGSMQKFGAINPLITDSSFEIIAGHGRYEAAKLLGLKQVPVILIDHLSEAEKRAYRLADNQLTLNTGHDDDLLKVEITDLMEMDLDFDLEIMGFETATLDLIIDDGVVIENDPADDIPAIPDDGPVITKAGDIWVMGKHRLICADALQEQSYKDLILTETAHMIFTDPPYNVSVNGHICGNGKIKHDEFAMASGEMSEEEFIKFLVAFIAFAVQHSRDGSLHYICMDWRHIFELLSAGRAHYTDLKNICVWNKDNGGMGSFYRSKYELVSVFKHGSKPHLNTIDLGRHGRYRTNVWDYRGVNGFAGQSDLEMHPTVKPVAMIVDAIKDCTRRNHIVMDPFAGSGSTLIACEKSGRQARCIELEPKYCDVIVRRWQKLTGLDAMHADTCKTFNKSQQGGKGDE
ncbi:MAG: site-specific DNA-methyltransferase [Alphaproteobacteria bacterium]